MALELTFVPSAALIVKGHDLGNQELRKRLIMRNTGQHFAEFLDNRHEFDRSLRPMLAITTRMPAASRHSP